MAKFFAGLITGDLLFGIWLMASGRLPESVIGIWVTQTGAWIWIGIDVIILIALALAIFRPKSKRIAA